MKFQANIILVITLVSGSLLLSSCFISEFFSPSSIPIPTATNTSTPSQTPSVTSTATATFTPTFTATSTATPTPTPNPAVFTNPPWLLKVIYTNPDWHWNDTIVMQLANRKFSDGTSLILSYYNSLDSIGISCKFNSNNADFEFYNDFVPVVLENFVSPSTAEKIIQFKDQNLKNEPDHVETEIDGFQVSLSISYIDNMGWVDLRITEENTQE